jgi:hypothetical protein
MDLFKNNLVAGVGLAFTAALLAPILMPAMGRVGRPLTKSLVRGGMLLYDKGREMVAVAGESVEDIMAEIRAESNVAAPPAGAPTSAAASGAASAPAGMAERRQTGNGARAPDATDASAQEAQSP